LVRLAALFDNKNYRRKAEQCFCGAYERLQKYPYILSKMVVALHAFNNPPPQIVVVGRKSDEDCVNMIKAIQTKHLPERLLVFFNQDKNEKDQWLLQKNSHFQELAESNKDKKPVVFICHNFACELPIYSMDQLNERLANL